MKNSNQTDGGYMRSAADTLEGMPEEELQEGIKGLEEWDAHFHTSKHYAPRFGSQIAKENNSIVKLLFLTAGILIVIYCVTVFF
jgi:hypothetical protein